MANYVSDGTNDFHLNPVGWIALLLMIIGAINWGLVGVLNFDLVAYLFGHMSNVARVIYAIVGIAAFYGIYMLIRLSTHGSTHHQRPLAHN